jgi:hypothetical protein
MNRRALRVVRGAPLVCAVVAVGGAATLTLRPTLSASWEQLGAAGTPPDRLLVSGIVVLTAVVLAGAWLWTLGCVVACVVEVSIEGPPPGTDPPSSLLRPRVVRLLVLAVVGSAVVGPPARADEHPPLPAGLSGLPLPDRAVGSGVSTAPLHRVRDGDSLWTIAEQALPPGSSPAAVDKAWRALYRANRPVVGPDPDLIHPGDDLRIPRSVRLPLPSTGDRP